MGRITKGEGQQRGILGGNGGIDGFDIFSWLQPPPDGGRTAMHDNRLASAHQRVDSGQWTHSGEGFGGGYREQEAGLIILIFSHGHCPRR